MRTTIATVVLLAFAVGFTSSRGFAAEKNPKPGERIGEAQKGGWLGVSIQDISPKIAKKKDLKSDEGAYVNDVVEDSPADSAGVKEGDVIVEFNGRKIDDADDLFKAVQKANAGSKTKIVVMRNNEKKSMDIAVGKLRRKHMNEGFAVTAPRAPRMAIFAKSGMWGLRLSELNEQLGEYFGAPNGKGLLVEKVERKSTGEKAGFKAGDVITKVNKNSVEDIRDLNEAAEDADKGDKLEIEILRKGANKILTVEIEERDIEPSSFNFQFENLPGGEMMREFDMDEFPHGDSGNLRMHLRSPLPDLRDLELKIEKIRKETRRITI
jgi:S1-C subfamily serine protease